MNIKPLFSCLTLCVALLGFTDASAQQQRVDTLAARVDSLFSKWNKPDSPGYVCAVMKDGKIVHAKGYGMADLEHNEPLTPESVFHVASIFKQFTAAVIALLVMTKTVSLDDDIRKYLPELPEFGKPILIRHLLYHTSGLRDYHELLGLTGWHDTDPLNNDMVVELLTRQRELNFEPGSEHLYSNSGYLLLAEIVKRASGQTLRTFAEERIFRPLDMTHTHFEDDHRQVVRHRVISYEPREGGGYNQLLKNSDACGDLGLLTTVNDLYRWGQNFYTAQVGGSPFLNLMLTRGVLTNGDTLAYAFGLVVGKYRGLLTVNHSGSQQGFRTEMVRFPEQRFAVTVLCNLKSINPSDLAYRIADLYLASDFSEAELQVAIEGAGDRKTVAVDTLLLDAYVGEYAMEAQPGLLFTFTREGTHFFGQSSGAERVEILASSDSTFFRAGSDAQATFHRNPDGSVSRFTLHQKGIQVANCVRLHVPMVTELAEYTGTYRCQELDTSYDLSVEADSLAVKQKGQRTSSVLTPYGRNTFSNGSGRVVFIRDENKQVVGLRYTSTSGRIRNLLIEREK